MSPILEPALRGHASTFTAPENDSARNDLSRLEARVHDASIQQDELSETRQQVLIDRQRVASSAQQIQTFRHGAAGKEARLMDIFRKYYMDLGESFPEDLVLAYSEVEHSRKDLTAAEDTHNKMERGLELSEWALIEQEDDVYQLTLPNLLQDDEDDNPVEGSSPTANLILPDPSCEVARGLDKPEQLAAVPEADESRKRSPEFLEFERGWSFEDCDRSKKMHVSSRGQAIEETLDPMLHRDMPAHNGPVQVTTVHTSGLDEDKRPSVSTMRPSLLQSPVAAPHGHDQVAINGDSLSAEEVSRMTPSINDWILTYLRMNATEKLHLVAILRAKLGASSHADLDFDDWSETVERFWTKEDTEDPDASNTKGAQRDTVSEVPVNWDKVAATLKQPNDWEKLPSFGSYDWFLSTSNEFDPYTPRNTELDLPALQSHSGSLPMGDYGSLDIENETDLQRPDEATIGPQPKQPLPLLQVIAPEDEIFSGNEPRNVSDRLSPMDNFRSRWDSVHNSEADREQGPPEGSMNTNHDHHSSGKNHSVDLGLPQTPHKMKAQDVLRNDQESDNVIYSKWDWSEDLQLFFRIGIYGDDEIVESDWLEGQDAKELWNHREHPQERTDTELKSYGFKAASYDSPYASSNEASRRNSEVDNCHESEMTTQSYAFSSGISFQSWHSSPSPDYLDEVRIETIWHDEHFIRVHPAQYNDFFNTGRIFHALSSETRRNSSGDESQVSIDSSPRRWSDEFWPTSGLFVVIFNRGLSSLCVRIESRRRLDSFAPYQGHRRYGKIESHARLLRPKSNDTLWDLPLRVYLKDESRYPLPSRARINYAVVQKIRHDRRLIEIGSVVEEDQGWLKMCFGGSATQALELWRD